MHRFLSHDKFYLISIYRKYNKYVMEKYKLIFLLVSISILILMIKVYYWRIQLKYGSILSLYTPDTFVFASNTKNQYDKGVKEGALLAKTKRAVIATMLRDSEKRIPAIIKRAEATGNLFADYRILIVENDSKDRTRPLLLDWARKNNKVTILGCGINKEECKIPKAPKTEGHSVDRARIEKMVMLRNIYLDYIKENYSDFDYVIIWDLDSISTTYLDGIQHTINLMENSTDENPKVIPKVVCANGIYEWPFMTIFYDTYATLDRQEPFDIDMKYPSDLRKGLWEYKMLRGDKPIEVDSCFSGFAIYKMDGLLDDAVKYDMTPGKNIECEHVRLHKNIKGKKIINPSMINLIVLND